MASATPLVALVLSGLALTTLTSCTTRSSTGPGRSRPDDTIVIGTGVDTTGINQLTGAHSRFSQDVIDLLFLHLFEEQPDFAEHPPTFEPEIVREYNWSDDNLELRLELRDDIVWSDGVPLTAEDVRWTFKAQTHPEVAWSYAQSKEAIERVEVLGPHSLVFHFSHVYSSRLADVNQGVVMPKHAWSELPFSEWRSNGDWFVRNLVVSGPYTITRWRPQEEIALEHNPLFHRDDRPSFRRVVFRVIPDRSHRLRQLLAGDLDFVEQLRRDDVPRLSASQRVRTVSYWHRQYSHVVWNGCRPPFSDPNVRLALTLAIDRQSIVDALFGDLARVGVTPIPQSVWAFNSELEPWPYDPVRARYILTTAGWSDRDGDGILDLNGEPFRFDLTTNSDNRLRVDAGAMIQNQLSKIGVDVRLITLEFNTLIDLNMRHDFDASIAAWGIDTTLDLGYAFHSDSANGGYNYGCYENQDVDALIEAVRRRSQLEDAEPLLRQLQAIIHHDQPYTFLWEPLRIDGVSRRLQGVASNPLSAFFDLDEWKAAAPGA
jgi:peptide/nickel transport system substrate-binding protein